MKSILKTTDDPRTYKSALKDLREKTGRIACAYCAYHTNENLRSRNFHKKCLKWDAKVCWKKLRKKQYR